MKSNDKYNYNNTPIVFCGDEDDENVYCSKCGLKLIPWNKQQLMCTDCERLYAREGILKHHKGLYPMERKLEDSSPGIVLMNDYTNKSKKRPSFIDEDDKTYKRPGFSWTSEETYWPQDEDR